MTALDDEILKGATNRRGVYSREEFIYLKIKKVFNQRNRVLPFFFSINIMAHRYKTGLGGFFLNDHD